MDFLLFKKAGNPLSCVKNASNRSKSVKTGLYSYGEIGQLQKRTPNLPSIEMGIGDLYPCYMEGMG